MFQWNVQVHNRRYENTTFFHCPKEQFFSQYNQDRSLENCVFKGFQQGVFMDVGAHDGVDLNNTIYFEKNNNWKGINVEPIQKVYDRLITNRPNCININCAVSNEDGIAEFVSNTGYTEMLSGLKSQYDERHLQRIDNENKEKGSYSEVISINTKRIESICNEHNIKHIHYLSIDVEGGELNVLKSIHFDKVFIDVIGFENNYNDIANEPIEYLIEKGYIKLPEHVADIFMIHKDSIFMKNVLDIL